MRFSRRNIRTDPFTDLLFNALIGFTFLFVIAILFLNPDPKSGVIIPKAEYIVTVNWEDMVPEDIDIWVEEPNGGVVWFRNPEAGLLHLDRDDRGNFNDTININGEEVVNPLNQEVVTLRGTSPGEYVVNLHYYEGDKPEIKASVKVEKVNPKLEVVYYGTVSLEGKGDEVTAVRFRVRADGSVGGVNSLPKSLVSVPSGSAR